MRIRIVGKFRPPGIAPACDEDGYFHVNLNGEPIYSQKYLYVAGYYEGYAAVQNIEGWFHIDLSGRPLYSERYRWVGNFQEGVCIVEDEEGMFHIDTDGDPIYAEKYSYAGDFKEGYAVVQLDSGLYTHIDRNGKRIHSKELLDLDVYHKSYARAKDYKGWFHIDINGQTLYTQRYRMVEPFYNNRARVETYDGDILIITPDGHVVREVRKHDKCDILFRLAFHELSKRIMGYWETIIIHTATSLGIIEQLPSTSETISNNLGLVESYVNRLLRALAEIGLVKQEREKWTLTTKGLFLKQDHLYSLASLVYELKLTGLFHWMKLPTILRSEYKTESFYKNIYRDKRTSHMVHRYLTSYALIDYNVLIAYMNIPENATVVDVGGGTGTLLQMIAQTGVSSQMYIVEHPDIPIDIQEYDQKIRLIKADIMSGIDVDADVVIIARLLHNLDDESAINLLRRCRDMIKKKNGHIFVIEFIPHSNYEGAMLDIHLLVLHGGRERSLEEYAKIGEESGLQLIGYYHTDKNLHIASLLKFRIKEFSQVE